MGTGGKGTGLQTFELRTNMLLVAPGFGSCELQKMQYCGLCNICYHESGSQNSTTYLDNLK